MQVKNYLDYQSHNGLSVLATGLNFLGWSPELADKVGTIHQVREAIMQKLGFGAEIYSILGTAEPHNVVNCLLSESGVEFEKVERCTFAPAGTYGHECGRRATHIVVFPSYETGRCDECARIKGGENRGMLSIRKI